MMSIWVGIFCKNCQQKVFIVLIIQQIDHIAIYWNLSEQISAHVCKWLDLP